MRLRVPHAFGFVLLIALPLAAQIKDIDSTKLPQNPAVQAAFRSAQDLEPYAESWTTKWHYDIPEAQVQDKLADDLGVLNKALQSEPSNHELQLLTGLVAHFAYNVNDEAAFAVATDNLTKAVSADPADVRGEWFLGIHQCQSLQVVEGMNRLLHIEETFKNPPADFWGDYIDCATIAALPAHTLRAIDRVVDSGQSRDDFKTLLDITNSRYKSADLTKTIGAHDAWADRVLPNNRDLFTSYLCGVSFTVDLKIDMRIPDVTTGTCSVGAIPPAKKKGEPSSTLLLMATMPIEGQSLDELVRSYLKDHDVFKDSKSQVSTAADLPCPVDHCLSLDVVVPGIYWKQGGAHFLVVAFERDQPRYDGLLFETPQGPMKLNGQKGPIALRIEPHFRRIPGKLYYLVLLDSNQQIFAGAKPLFEDFVHSIVVE